MIAWAWLLGTALLAIAGDALAHQAEPGQAHVDDVERIARLFPLVSLHRGGRLKVSKSPEVQAAEDVGEGGERRQQQPGEMPEVHELGAEIHGSRELMVPVHAPSIHQKGWPALAKPGQSAVGAVQADPVLNIQVGVGGSHLNP